MRGEETQIAGIVSRYGVADGLFCLPGTHSKWVHVARGHIRFFATFMTGECFAVLKGHSILGRLMADDADDDGTFRRGLLDVDRAGGLLHWLFAARTLGLVGTLPASAIASFRSGQLIGAEIAGARTLFESVDGVHLIAAGDVGARYAEAFDALDIACTRWDADEAAVAGLWAAAEATGIIGEHS